MSELREVLKQTIDERLEQVILSNPTDPEYAAKIKIRPVRIKGELLFQQTLYRGTQVFHENLTAEAARARIGELLEANFRQAQISTQVRQATVLVSKKGKMTVKVKQLGGEGKEKQLRERDLSHNREKQYILKEGVPVDFLVGLGVQSPDGHVVKNRYDKFRQINRYLEFIEDILDKLPVGHTIHIVDFGCGKSYLTFAMYYYLHVLQGRDIRVTGLDLKKDVIAHCNALAQRCGYEGLHFQVGDIKDYNGESAVDMVVSLHACDTATDYALEKAVRWGARVIMAVPCCQHEVNRQIVSRDLQPILKYGLIKERMSALITDAVRANVLEEQGYDTQILEFIDMEHTPKNLLIRAVKQEKTEGRMRKKAGGNLEETLELLHIDPTLKRLFE